MRGVYDKDHENGYQDEVSQNYEDWQEERVSETLWERFESVLDEWFDDLKKGILFLPYLVVFSTSVFFFGSNEWRDSNSGPWTLRDRSWLRRGVLGLFLDALEIGIGLLFGTPAPVSDRLEHAEGILEVVFRALKYLSRGFTDFIIQKNPGIINLAAWVAIVSACLAFWAPVTFASAITLLYTNLPVLNLLGTSTFAGIAACSLLSVTPFVLYSFVGFAMTKAYSLILDLGHRINDWVQRIILNWAQDDGNNEVTVDHFFPPHRSPWAPPPESPLSTPPSSPLLPARSPYQSSLFPANKNNNELPEVILEPVVVVEVANGNSFS